MQIWKIQSKHSIRTLQILPHEFSFIISILSTSMGGFPGFINNWKNIANLSLKKKQILEIGCRSGALCHENIDKIPANIDITLSDISEGMVRDIKRSFDNDRRFEFNSFDCHKIPYANDYFDVVIANHVLFYCKDIPKVCHEVRRVLKKGAGIFICSTYGSAHMQEITQLVQHFDNRIVLSGEKLYEKISKFSDVGRWNKGRIDHTAHV